MEIDSINKYISVLKKVKIIKLSSCYFISKYVSTSPDKQSLYFLPIRVFKDYIFAGICNGNKRIIMSF